MPEPVLLNQEERAEVLRMYGEMSAGYKQLLAAVAAGNPSGEIKTKLDKIDQSLMDFHKSHTAAVARIDAVEAAAAKRLNALPQSFGERVIADPLMAAHLKSGARGQCNIEVKSWRYDAAALAHAVKDITGLSLQLPEMLAAWATGPRLPLGVRQLLPQGRTTAGAVEYVRETSFTNNAAVVAEGAAKPKSDKVFTPVTSPVRTIAHIFKVSKQSWEDLPALQAQIESNGIYGVQLAEDNQLLNGSGVAPQIDGLVKNATAGPAAPVGASLIDAIGLSVFDLAARGYIADGTVVNAVNWGVVAMLKNSQGNYLFANPMDYAQNARVWGTTLVQSANMAAGTFLTGAFRGNTLLLDRETVNVQVAEQNVDDFEKNMLTVRIEERIALAIYDAAALAKGVIPAPVGVFAADAAAAPETETRKRQRE